MKYFIVLFYTADNKNPIVQFNFETTEEVKACLNQTKTKFADGKVRIGCQTCKKGVELYFEDWPKPFTWVNFATLMGGVNCHCFRPEAMVELGSIQ